MIALLERWNRWGTATLASGSRRDVVQGLGPFLDTKEVIGLVGPRRAGKSTVLYQIMDMLAERGVLSEQMLHVNFEDPGFALELGTELLDRIWSTFREEVAGSAYRSLLPPDQKPPADLNAGEMAKYRDLMRPHYLTPEIRFR